MELPTLLEALTPIAAEEMRTYYETQTTGICLETSRCLRLVFQHYGYAAHPRSVFYEVYNPLTSRLLLEAERAELSKEEKVRILDASFQVGGWSVGCYKSDGGEMVGGFANGDIRKGGYNGHLLLRVEDVLVDASIKQADRPQHNIHLPEMLAVQLGDAADDFERGKCKLSTSVNSCLIRYQKTFDNEWKWLPGWSKEGGRNPRSLHNEVEALVVGKIIERIEVGASANPSRTKAGRGAKNWSPAVSNNNSYSG